MGATKVTLARQLSSLELVRGQWVNITSKKAGMSAREVQYTLEALDQIRTTLGWLQTHGQTIRDAIAAARALDAADPEQ
jgi:hypothetical protein